MHTPALTRGLLTRLLIGLIATAFALSQAWASPGHSNGRHAKHGNSPYYAKPYYAKPYVSHRPAKKNHRAMPYRALPYRARGRGFARVVAVKPIIQSRSYQIPQQQCWTEPMRDNGNRTGSNRATTATLIGGIIGAAIGHDLGRNHHQDNQNIKTVAAGLLGAAIGRDISRRNQARQIEPDSAQFRSQQRCDTQYQTHWQQQIIGYDVTYRYRGETFNSRMDYDPGDKIRVNVRVRPVF